MLPLIISNGHKLFYFLENVCFELDILKTSVTELKESISTLKVNESKNGYLYFSSKLIMYIYIYIYLILSSYMNYLTLPYLTLPYQVELARHKMN